MSRKQWGYGFYRGREKIINDLIREIRPVLEDDQAAIYLRQVGGKYCSFTCPICGEKDQGYKRTANVGSCLFCKSRFYNLDIKHELTPDKSMMFADCVGIVLVEIG